MRDQVMAEVRAHFRPEFLNRVDEIILFHRLKREQMGRIVDIQIERLQKLLEDRKIALTLDAKAREWLAEKGYDPAYGARPLKRVIQKIGAGSAGRAHSLRPHQGRREGQDLGRPRGLESSTARRWRRRRNQRSFPGCGAARRGAPLIRDRTATPTFANNSGSAAHHFARCAAPRETYVSNVAALQRHFRSSARARARRNSARALSAGRERATD